MRSIFYAVVGFSFLLTSCSTSLKTATHSDDDVHHDTDFSSPDVDEVTDETVDEIIDEDVDEIADEADIDEIVDETTDEDNELQPMITNIKIEPNPNSVISCIVTWDTDVASASTVKFFAENTAILTISDEEIVNQHRVVVVGMKEKREYSISVISGTTEEEAGLFTTDPLPEHLTAQSITVNKLDKTNPGWTLFTMTSSVYSAVGTGTTNLDFPTTVVAYDMVGDVVWYSIQPDMTLGDTRYYPERGLITATTMRLAQFKTEPAYIEISLEGNVVFSDPQQPLITAGMDSRYHHTFERRPNGNLWSIRHNMETMPNGANPVQQVLGDDIVEMDPLGNIIWEWNIFDYETPDLSGVPSTTVIHDWTHANYLFLSDDESTLYLNTRHRSLVYKIDKFTGNIIWRFGFNGDFRFEGDSPIPWPHFAHAAKILKNGNILIYDNGNDIRDFSRAIEYEIDEVKMTAKIVWQYDGGYDRWQTNYWGDADRLPNGNTFICAGTLEEGVESVLKEISPSGEKVWEMVFPLPADNIVLSVYNAVRINPPTEIVR